MLPSVTIQGQSRAHLGCTSSTSSSPTVVLSHRWASGAESLDVSQMIPTVPSAGSLMLHKDDFDHIFSDSELQTFLDKIAAADTTNDDALDMFQDAPMGLQFLPPENPVMAPNDQNGAAPRSSMSSYDDLPRSATAAAAAAAAASAQASAAAQQHLKALSIMAAAQCNNPVMGLDALTTLASGAMGLPTTVLPSPAFSIPMGLSSGRGSKVAEQKPQVSHSTVEKQRRDRINSLIDELRELVPPSKATLAAAAAAGGSAKDAANSEARRPKHVVLADTIALLKQLQLKGPLAALISTRSSITLEGAYAIGSPPQAPTAQPPSVIVKDEPNQHISPSNSNSKGSVSSHEDMEMKDDGRTGAPKLPNIPIQPTMLSGVVVERGPDCMYVQVKCRDRKGLLLDIINALKQLPLEVRTAAVTTQEGLVRDVFEVKVDDQQLQPEEVQNMVHEALFQQYNADHKRARC